MGKPLGNKQSFIAHAQVDEDGISYGIKHTKNCPHVVISDGTNTADINDFGGLETNIVDCCFSYL
jgi:hypothetical protein